MFKIHLRFYFFQCSTPLPIFLLDYRPFIMISRTLYIWRKLALSTLNYKNFFQGCHFYFVFNMTYFFQAYLYFYVNLFASSTKYWLSVSPLFTVQSQPSQLLHSNSTKLLAGFNYAVSFLCTLLLCETFTQFSSPDWLLRVSQVSAKMLLLQQRLLLIPQGRFQWSCSFFHNAICTPSWEYYPSVIYLTISLLSPPDLWRKHYNLFIHHCIFSF